MMTRRFSDAPRSEEEAVVVARMLRSIGNTIVLTFFNQKTKFGRQVSSKKKDNNEQKSLLLFPPRRLAANSSYPNSFPFSILRSLLIFRNDRLCLER
jgi:hypothetical protein